MRARPRQRPCPHGREQRPTRDTKWSCAGFARATFSAKRRSHLRAKAQLSGGLPRDPSPLGESRNAMITSNGERVCLDERRHAVVLAGPFLRALALAAVGIGCMAVGWPASIAGVVLQVAGAVIVLRAVWSWERTRVVITTEKLFIVHGTLRRRAAAVRLARLGAVEIEQSLTGRLLGYGTIVAGELEIEFVPEPRRVYGLVERLSA